MDFSANDAKTNLKSVIQESEMMDAFDHCLKRYIDQSFPLLESISVCAKKYKVKKSRLEELVRECIPKEYISYRSNVLKRKLKTGR